MKYAKKHVGFLRSEPYECKFDWPEKDCYCQCGEGAIALTNIDGAKLVEEMIGAANPPSKAVEVLKATIGKGNDPEGSYRTAFFEAFPKVIDDFVRGEGSTLDEAEKDCWERYQKILNCPKHEYVPSFYKDGQGVCKHCRHFAQSVLPLLRVCIICSAKVYGESEGKTYCEKHFADTAEGKKLFAERQRLQEQLEEDEYQG